MHGGHLIKGDGQREVGRYRLLRRLGEGGMAVVHLAHDHGLDREVALKEVLAEYATDPQWTQRFLRESRVVGSLKHPSIVTVFDYLEQDGAPYIAMEYVERGSLRPYVGMLTMAQNVFVLECLFSGLAHAEGRGIVHRDLKPENLLVTEDGRVKIADFGIAKVASELTPTALRTAVGVTVGTPLYMAPEQALAQSDRIGPWTDLYAAGCVAYELFTGGPPFSSITDARALMLHHINEPVPPAHEVNENVDRMVSAWIDRLLVKDPDERVRSAEEAWESLEEIAITRLGARWRRSARLPDLDGLVVERPPLSRSGFVNSAALAAAGDGEVFVSYSRPPTPRPPVVTPVELLSDFVPWHRDAPDGAAAAALPLGAAGAERAEPAAPDEPAPTRPPRRPPEPPPVWAPTPARRSRGPLLAAGGVLAAAVLAVVLVVALGGDPEPPPTDRAVVAPAASTLAAGPLSVRLPGGWGRRATDGLGALELDDAAVAGPAGDAGGTVVLGMAATTSPTLLAPALAETAAAPATETLAGGLSAYRYDALDLGGGERASVYVVPTDAGVATVACRQPAPADPAFAPACAEIARSLAIRDARVFPAGPSPVYASEAGTAVRDLNRLLRGAESGLRSARTPAGQARNLRGAGPGLTLVAEHLRTLDVSPADGAANTALAAATRDLAAGYRALAGAARRSSRGGYATAGSDVRRARAAAAGVLDDLRAAGYAELPALAPATVPQLRSKPKPKPKPKAPSQPATSAPAQPQTPTPQATAAPSRPTYTPPSTPSTPQSKYGPRKGSTPEDG